MKAIHADPKDIRKIFAEKYIIPDFQRPYSWDKDLCEQLWEDIISFFEQQQSKDETYFLGNIVIYKSGDSYSVIDGQQRLTTLLLLIKAFHSKAGTAQILDECLRIKDPLTSQLTDKLRLNSHVITEDKDNLYDIIFNNGENIVDDCNLKTNYIFFCDKIDTWWKYYSYSTDKLNSLILCFLDQLVLLPIHCGSQDDALTIFETINNRGLSLTDSDIFKAKLYNEAGDDKDVFINKWNALDDHLELFRILMHIFRAKEKDASKEIGLRSYFTDNKKRLSDWQSVMDDLTMISFIEKWDCPADINILWLILYDTYPNQYWKYPLHVFLHKYGKLQDDEFSLPENQIPIFHNLLETTVKFFFLKGVVYNSVNHVRDTVFKVCVAIESEQDYLSEYTKTISHIDIKYFNGKLQDKQYGKYEKGLILLSAYLNPKQKKEDFDSFMSENNYHIEHILPKKWNNYDLWTEKTWEEDLNSIGNLIPLEYRLNINARNHFFSRKKESYRTSKVQDALDLLKLKDWTPDALRNLEKKKNERLKKFFRF